MPEFGPPLMPECEHTKPLTGPVIITTTTAPSCVFCERDKLRAENERLRTENQRQLAAARLLVEIALERREALLPIVFHARELAEALRQLDESCPHGARRPAECKFGCASYDEARR